MNYEDYFPLSIAGTVCKQNIQGVIDEHGLQKVRENVNILTENIYRKLPSGDYGRGDVRRMVIAMAGITVTPQGTYTWEGQ